MPSSVSVQLHENAVEWVRLTRWKRKWLEWLYASKSTPTGPPALTNSVTLNAVGCASSGKLQYSLLRYDWIVFISVTIGPAAASVRHGCIFESGDASRKMPVLNASVQWAAVLFGVESEPTKAVIATDMSS